MKGVQQLGGKLIKVVNSKHIVRVPLKSGNTALLQLNETSQKLDCLVLRKGKAIYNHSVQNVENGYIDNFISHMAELIQPYTQMDIDE